MTTQLPALRSPADPSPPPSGFERPQLPRRAFLGRVAAALAIGTTANVGVIVARSAPIAAPTESAELLAMGSEMDRLEGAFVAADEKRRAARPRRI